MSDLLPPLILELKAQIGEFTAKMTEAGTSVKDMAEKSEGHTTKMGQAITGTAAVGKAALLGLGGAAIVLGGESLHMADTWELSHARMETALTNMHQPADAWKGAVDSIDSSLEKLGFTNAQTEDSVSKFVTSGLTQKQTMDAAALAANIAAARGIDLSSATDIVTKAYEGNSKAVRALGIDLPIVTGNALAQDKAQTALANSQQKVTDILAKYPAAAKAGAKGHDEYLKATEAVKAAQDKLNATQASGTDIVTALSDRYGGQASAKADTFAGKMQTLRADTEDLGAKVGMWLVPKLDELMGATEKVVSWMQQHKTAAEVLGGVVGGVLTVAIGTYVGTLVAAGVKSSIEFAKDIAEGVGWVAKKVGQLAMYEAAVISSAASTAAAWVASSAATLADSVAQGAIWVAGKLAQYAIVAAVAIASAVATAAAWIAANLAMIVASGGILLAIGLIVAAGIWLYNNWDKVMAFVREAIHVAWEWIKDRAAWIYDKAIKPLIDYMALAAKGWGIIFADIKATIHNAWQWILDRATWIYQKAIQPVIDAVNLLGRGWGIIFDGIKSTVANVWNFLSPIFDNIAKGVKAVISGVSSIPGVGSALKTLGVPGFAVGGEVPGPIGAPTLAVVHGGEYVLSTDMRAGRAAAPGAITAQPPGGSGTYNPVTAGNGPSVTVYASTNASAHQIAAEIGWQLRLAG